MNIFEIAVGELVSSLRVLWKTTIDAQMAFGVLCESMKTNELILFIC